MPATTTTGVFSKAVTPDIALILDSIPDGLYGSDKSGRIVLVNRAAASMLGYPPHELVGRPPHEVMHHTRPNGSAYPLEECPLVAAARDGGECVSDEDLFWRRDGTSFPVEYQSHPLRIGETVVGAVVTFRDITARKENAEQMRELLRDQFLGVRAEFRHAQLREVLAQAPAAICVTRGPRHIIEMMNEQYQHLVAGRDVIGQAVRDAFPHEDQRVTSLMDLAFETGEPQRAPELPVAMQATAGAQVAFFDTVYQPLRDDSGVVYGLLTHAVDVTEQVQARRTLESRTQELERVAAHLRMAAEAGRLGTWEWELPNRRIIWSPEIERIHGLELGTFAGTFEAFQSDLHPDDHIRVLAQVDETIQHHAPYRIEYRIVRPDGDTRWIEARGQMFLDPSGSADRVVGICMDVTDRKNAEEALEARAEDLKQLADALERSNHGLDAFAYAASHDLRAPLRGIANLAQWIEEDLTAAGEVRPDTREMLELMRSRMHRMESLIEGILEYSRAGRLAQTIEYVDVSRLVQETADLMAIPEPASVRIGDLPSFHTSRLPLQQIFMNLIGNALKHSNRPDTLVTIGAREAGKFYEFSVSDNGPGIPAEYHKRIWGIFQTLETRDTVEGTGIGLALVKKLVEAQGGRAWVESPAGAGATFRFLWPKQIRTVGESILGKDAEHPAG